MSGEWYTNQENVLALAEWLLENDDSTIPDRKELLYLFEKPWKWDTEWQAFQTDNERTEA